MKNVFVFGSSGRVGRSVVRRLRRDKTLAPAKRLNAKVDFVVDFSSPEGALDIIEECAKMSVPVVTGTTGFTPLQMKRLKKLSEKVAVFWSPNMAVGVFEMLDLCKTLLKGNPAVRVSILEIHRRGKKDKPSGTAKMLFQELSLFVKKRKIKTKIEKPKSLRIGDVMGVHELQFQWAGDCLTLKHEVQSRDVFATGALKVGKWLSVKSKGLYEMSDFLREMK